MRTKLLLLYIICLVSTAYANNVNVTNVQLVDQDVATHSVSATFNVSWDNSWRTGFNEANYDGVWVFAKYRLLAGSQWRHCTLRVAGSSTADGSMFTIPTDRKGAFIYRTAENFGTGNVNFLNNRLIWDYGADSVPDATTVEIKVFAIEMVYVPSGSYYLGSGGTEANAFKAGSSNNPYQVTSNSAIALNETTGLSLNGLGTGVSIPANFPNGYDAFWIMKYECSQQQFADFLNTLTLQQATNLNVAANNVTGSYPNFIPIAPDRAFSYRSKALSFRHVSSMAEWSGLRPLSELEFEKACRGVNVPPVPNEFAWGSDVITPLTAVINAGLANEYVPTDSNANALYADYLGGRPARVGIFARWSNSTRQLSGATYYGIMNMSDNVFERVIFVGSDEGRAINRTTHGTGNLNLDGYTDNVAWQTAMAFTRRGTSFFSTSNEFGSIGYARVSNRAVNITTDPADGIRLVRTAQ